MQYDATYFGPYFTVDTLTLNASTDANGCDWIITSEKGWFGKPAVKTNRVDKPAARGTFIGSEHPAARVITLAGRLNAPDAPTMRDAVDKLLGICADPNTLYPITCTDERGLTLAAQCRLDGEILATPVNWNTVDFSIQLVCPDPRKTAATQTEVSAVLTAAGLGGLAYPLAFPLNYGTPGIPGSLVLTNPGSAEADILFSIRGPVTNPLITDTATGNTTAYLGALSASDLLTVDTSSGRVLLNGIDRRGLLSVTRWPRIPRNGKLSLIFSSSNSSDTGSATASFRASYY